MKAWQIAILAKAFILAAYLILVRSSEWLARRLPDGKLRRLLLLRL